MLFIILTKKVKLFLQNSCFGPKSKVPNTVLENMFNEKYKHAVHVKK